jgi:hypothetical protein
MVLGGRRENCINLQPHSSRHWNAAKMGKGVQKRGRPHAVSEKLVEELTKRAARLDEQQQSMSSKKFETELYAAMRKTVESAGGNKHAVRRPSASTIRKYRRQIVARKVKKPGVQNLRRLLVSPQA